MTVKLLVVQGRPQGKSLLFPPGTFVFGRGIECHVRPNSDWVSRQHCMLRVSEDGVYLRDLGSRNGTLVNGSRLKGECRLEHGDKLQVGPLVFQLVLDAEAGPVPTFTPPSSGDLAIPALRDTQKMSDVMPADPAEVRDVPPEPGSA